MCKWKLSNISTQERKCISQQKLWQYWSRNEFMTLLLTTVELYIRKCELWRTVTLLNIYKVKFEFAESYQQTPTLCMKLSLSIINFCIFSTRFQFTLFAFYPLLHVSSINLHPRKLLRFTLIIVKIKYFSFHYILRWGDVCVVCSVPTHSPTACDVGPHY